MSRITALGSHLLEVLERQGFDRRARLAMLMALVAILGAATAFRATQNELGASACERKLNEEQMLGLVFRSEDLAKRLEYEKWHDRYNFHVGQGQLLLGQARALREHPTSASGYSSPDALDIQAQVEFAVARQLKPLNDFTYIWLGTGPPEDTLAARAGSKLEQLGFSGRCVESRRGPSGPAAGGVDYAKLKADAEAIEARTVRSALAIVGYVLALVFFTLSDVMNPAYRAGLEGTGCAAALAALGVGIWIDHGLWVYYAVTVLAFPLISALGWRLVLWLKLGGTSDASDEPPDAATDFHLDHARWHVHIGPVHHPFGAVTLFGISLVALFSALATWGYSDAVAHARQAAAAALEHQVSMFRESTLRHAEAFSLLDRLALLQERRTHARAAQQALALSRSAETRPDDETFWSLESDRWDKLMSKLIPDEHKQKEWLDFMGGSWAPDKDSYFPAQLMYNVTVPGPAKELALWDGEDASSLTWGQKATHYLAALTLFAIALYLFGQSLGLGRSRGAQILVFFGCLLAAHGVALGIQGLTQPTLAAGKMPIPAACRESGGERPAAAAREEVAAFCYARGQLLEKLARTDRDHAAARDAYEEAVKARPDFPAAQKGLASMTARAESPQASSQYYSVIGVKNLKALVEARKKTIDYMEQRHLRVPQLLLGNYAFESYMDALESRNRTVLQRSIQDADRASQLDKRDLSFQYNLAVAYLADGQIGKAQSVFDEATGELKKSPDSDVALAAITDFEILLARCPALSKWYAKRGRYCENDLRRRVTAFKNSLVLAVWNFAKRGSVGVPDSVTVGVSLDGVGWQARRGFRNAGPGHVLVALWYRWDSHWGWYTLPHVSGQVDPSVLEGDGRGGVELFESQLRQSQYQSCLEAGSYRVEFYLDGELVLTVGDKPQTPVGLTRFQAVAFRDLGLALCYPSAGASGVDSWVPWRPSDASDPGFIAGYTSGDRKARGALLFGYVYPRRTFEAAERIERGYIEEAIARLRGEGIVHGSGRLVSIHCGYWDNWGKPHVQYVFSGYPAVAVLAKAWTGADGLVHVAVVWRPVAESPDLSATDYDLSCRVLTSITSVDPDVPR